MRKKIWEYMRGDENIGEDMRGGEKIWEMRRYERQRNILQHVQNK